MSRRWPRRSDGHYHSGCRRYMRRARTRNLESNKFQHTLPRRTPFPHSCHSSSLPRPFSHQHLLSDCDGFLTAKNRCGIPPFASLQRTWHENLSPRHIAERGDHVVTRPDCAQHATEPHRSAKPHRDFCGSMDKVRVFLERREGEAFSGSMAITRSLTQKSRRQRRRAPAPCDR